MKIKKILFSVFMIAAMSTMAVVGFKGSNKVVTATATETEAQALLAKYWNNGVYTKQTTIFVTEEVQEEGKKVFHAGANALERTTYYNGTELWMTNAEATINSGYGTDGSDMTHFKKDANGNNVVDYKVKGTSMEQYYVTLDDIKTSSGWTKSGSVYTSTNDITLDQFRQFVAPMWLSSENSANYAVFTKATIEQTSAGLVMKLYVGSTNSAYVTTKAENEHHVFAQAIVTRDLYSILTSNGRYHLDYNDNKSDSWALYELMGVVSLTANESVKLQKYYYETNTINEYSGNFKNSKVAYTHSSSTVYFTFYENYIKMHATTGQYFYLKPNSNWVQANARFAARLWVDSPFAEVWVDMVDTDKDGIYEAELPDAKYTKVIFCRMNPSTTENNWDNKWDQSGNLTINLGKKWTVNAGQWNNATGSWSAK